jgi:putative hydrolase of the HAD superfamily
MTSVTTVLVDFGGVLTTSVVDSFRRFGEQIGNPDLPLQLLSADPDARRLLSEHESGRIDAAAFEYGFAQRLRCHGADVAADGLQARMQAGVQPDPAMLELLARVRQAGTPVALVSNAFGRDAYAGFDLDTLVDTVVISSEVGVRKPSRRIYRIVCERMGIAPQQAVLIDDLQQNLDGAARLGIAGILHTSAANTQRQLATRFGLRCGDDREPPQNHEPQNQESQYKDVSDTKEEL